MRVRVVAAGTRLPEWVNAGFEEYARRLPGESRLELKEIAVSRGGGAGDGPRALKEEGERMLKEVLPGSFTVALEVTGRVLGTEALARWWAKRLADGRDVTFLIGGPDGLAKPCRERADASLSLSALTFPHALARIILAEQLYRVSSLLKGHPYHRA